MREILFRAKAINRDPFSDYRTSYKNGDWVYGLITRQYDERFETLPAEMTNTDGVSGIDVDYKTIGQFTGLIDKNGKKIFEGDILTSEHYPYTSDGDKNYFAEVIWLDNRHAFGRYRFKNPKLSVNGISQGNCGYFEGWVTNWEVIGNKYDNPEFFKTEKGDEGNE